MAAVDNLDKAIEQWHLASDELLKGNPEPVKKLWSHQEDITVANPYGPPARGWEQVAKTVEHASSLCRDGEFVGAGYLVAVSLMPTVVLVHDGVALASGPSKG